MAKSERYIDGHKSLQLKLKILYFPFLRKKYRTFTIFKFIYTHITYI